MKIFIVIALLLYFVVSVVHLVKRGQEEDDAQAIDGGEDAFADCLDEAYEILNVSPDASDAAVRLASQNLTPVALAAATDRMTRINLACKAIKQARALQS